MAERLLVTTWWEKKEFVRGKRRELTWEKLRDRLRRPRHRLEEVNTADEEEWNKAKKTLPLWAPTAYREDHRAKDAVERLSCLVLDSDKGATLDELAVVFAAWSHVIHTSGRNRPGMTKARIVLPLTRDVTPEEHGRLYAWALAYAESEGIALDATTAAPFTDWFVPAEINDIPFAHAVRNAPWLDPDTVLPAASVAPQSPPPPPAKQPPGDRDREAVRLKRWGEKRLLAQIEKVADAEVGGRNKALTAAAFKIGQYLESTGLSEAAARDGLVSAATGAGMPEAEAADVVRRQLAAGKKRPKTPTLSNAVPSSPAVAPSAPSAPTAPPADAHPFAPGDRQPSWTSLFIRDHYGRPEPGSHNALIAFDHDVRLRAGLAFDVHEASVIWTRPPPWANASDGKWPQPNSDEVETRARAWLDVTHRLRLSQSEMGAAIWATAKRRQIDPVRDYLERVKWDGRPRFLSWLSDYIGAPVSDYVKEIGRRWLLSAVARIFQPGAKVDHVLVLEGPQGRGKSTVIEILGGEWFSDAKIDMSSKEGQLLLGGVWIQELPELASMKAASVETVKQFVTLRRDKFRPPYGRNVVRLPRRTVFAASTNAAQYLIDETGNRRFWPVPCLRRFGYAKVEEMRKDRDALWAEAVDVYRRGLPLSRWWLDPNEDAELIRQAAEIQEARREPDPWEAVLAHWIANREFVTTSDALREVGLEPKEREKRHEMRMAAVFRTYGYSDRVRRRQKDGTVPWGYVRPEDNLLESA